MLRTSDGTTWGVRETDMLMNNYVDHEVTVAGDPVHPTASERSAGGAHHFLRAYDVVVESDSCTNRETSVSTPIRFQKEALCDSRRKL